MLTTTERILFVLMALILGGLTAILFYGIYKIIRRGRPAPPRENVIPSLIGAAIDVLLQRPMFRSRPVLSVFHAFIFFGFSYYFLVNVTDVLEGFVPGFELIYGGQGPLEPLPDWPINLFNLIADILSVLTLLGMIVFLVRRFITHDKRLEFNEGVLLNPKVQQGWIRYDSLIVGVFILLHVGSRFLGQALRLAENGRPDPFMPFASAASFLFRGLSEGAFTFGIHLTWWLALGLILLFLPYFVRSKHIHLMVAPLNLGLGKPGPRGELDPATPPGSDDDAEPGAKYVQDLAWPRLMDAYACIMCNRCNDVCPAHSQGLVLSPAAVEVNKRWLFNEHFADFAYRGNLPDMPLTQHVISPEAVWACTTCYACVRVCPVGNEPMADIVDIRRRMIIEGEEMDSGIQTALESLAKNGNWFGKGSRARARWTKGLEFKVKDVTKEEAEYLWFVGDTASFDARVIPITQTVANVFQQAGVDFGILGRAERNSGNDVRRVGEEGLFEQLAEDNAAAFGKAQFKKIVTTDPHSLNALRNEYGPFVEENWEVLHYTNLLLELFESGKLSVSKPLSHYRVTYHDPCYLGRYNGEFSAPRKLLEILGVEFQEMPRNCENSYCCGAGGGQIWLGITPEGERPAENRIREALDALAPSSNGAAADDKQLLFVVTCPKDVIMYTDAVKTTGNEGKIEVRDMIQLVEEAISG
ncbi:MAG: (Fe-S)-binding protein [Chloroflexi bacterium]|nr:(Fe-S)-binding protein [Chloroflexota bacterium]